MIRRIFAAIVVLALVAIFAVAGYILLQPLPQRTVQQASPTRAVTQTPTVGVTINGTAGATPSPVQGTPTSASVSTGTATAEATPSPLASPPAATATRDAGLATLESLDTQLLPRRDPVALGIEYGRTSSRERTARTTPIDHQIGSRTVFNVSDIANDSYYTSTATLVVALDHVLMYVEDGVDVDLAALEKSARAFNDQIYPRTREVFGEEWSPGVDGDVRLTIFNGKLTPGIGGYFNSFDEVPRALNRFSNEREMFYMNVDAIEPGTPTYLSVLAHEFQHMIQWHEAGQGASWMNEGLSQVAEDMNGFDGSSAAPFYLRDPDLQLTDWISPTEPESLAHYGAAYLFLSYVAEQYKTLDFKRLIREGAGARLDTFMEQIRTERPDIGTFGDLYADWSVANLLDDPTVDNGRYAYAKVPVKVQPDSVPSGGLQGKVAQFGTDYIEIPAESAPQMLAYDGSDTVPILGDEVQGAAWWSNRGDGVASTLTRTVDLRNVTSATLRFRLWYNIESNFDYAYVSASSDGQRWQTLPGKHTTTEDPQGVNFGNGYTGRSGQNGSADSAEDDGPASWVDEEIDLSQFAGQIVTLRFSLVTDDAVNKTGMVIDNISIPEIGFQDTVDTAAEGWSTDGWQRTDNQLPQLWELRLVRSGNGERSVEVLEPDATGRIQAQLAGGEDAVLIIAATTSHTTERASYTLTVNSIR